MFANKATMQCRRESLQVFLKRRFRCTIHEIIREMSSEDGSNRYRGLRMEERKSCTALEVGIWSLAVGRD